MSGTPRVDPDPREGVGELALLEQYLDYQRATVLQKSDGLGQEQMATARPPSSLTLAGILYHLALVEETWTEVRFAGLPARPPWIGHDWKADREWDFRTGATLAPDEVRARYLEACARSREVVAHADDLGQMSARALDNGEPFSLRWMLLHLIEETARHAGHADLLREAIDGVVGE